jgi:mannose-1-phosphate guanylyltransferase
MRIAVVMAGGTGERFWPVSRPERPKQLLRLTHPTMNMIEEAVHRISPGIARERVYISTSRMLQGPLSESGAVRPSNVLAEPARRNTLGAICWAVASLIASGHGHATLAILTSDHKIDQPGCFLSTVAAAMEMAERQEALVTIGVTPTRPETGYGYIQVDGSEEFETETGQPAFRAARFREKPSRETAEEFLAAGTFLWNSGMFFFSIPTFRRELQRAQPAAGLILDRIADAIRESDEREATLAFEELPNLSIDYALMEQAERVFVVPATFPWDDVGAWDALGRAFPLDEDGNAVQGQTLLVDTSDCVVINDDANSTVAALGVNGMVIVNTADAVLVCPKGRAQEVRKIVERLL